MLTFRAWGQERWGTQEPVGRGAMNRFTTPVNQLLTPAGTLVELPGMRPHVLALSPNGRVLLTSGLAHDLVVLDPRTGKILQHVPMPLSGSKGAALATQERSSHEKKDRQAGRTDSTAGETPTATGVPADPRAEVSFTGLTFSPDGSRAYLSDLNGEIKVFAVGADGQVEPLYSIPLPPANAPRRAAEIPTGIAVSRDGKRLYVALNLSNRLAEIDPTTGQILRLWDTGVEPYDVKLAGDKIYVSNWGGRRPDKDSLVGPAGSGTVVRVDPIRHIASEGSVSVIDLTSARTEHGMQNEILTGLHACAMEISPNGRYLAVANAGSDTITVIDVRTDKILENISARQNRGDPFGAQPNALAFDKRGKMLFACNGTQNAVAVIRFDPGKSRLDGLIPVGWFPATIAFDAKRGAIYTANIKGMYSGRSGHANTGREYNSLQWQGSISLVPLPSRKKLAEFTESTLSNLRYPLLAQAKLPPRARRTPAPVPVRVGEPSVFKHVIYIIKENRTYDQMLGDMEEGNGNAALCIFGERYTPNQHKLARQFVLLDNTYCCGSKSSDGHQWTDSAMASDYMERSFASSPRSYPAGGDILTEDALAYSPAGFLWDNALAHGKTLRDYGEFSQAHRAWKDPSRKGKPGFLDVYRAFNNGTDEVDIWSKPNIATLRAYQATNTVGWDLDIPDVFRAAQFIRDLKRSEATGDFPALNIIWLPNDHTAGTAPGAPTPGAQVADNDLAFGQIVEAVSHSRFWKDTCIFAIEDDPQSGWDHVSAYRTEAYVASAYTKRGEVIHTQYNTTSLLRTIELILGLPPMNQMDATATPMFDCFTNVPDLTAFVVTPNNIPLDQMNPPARKVSDLQLRKDAHTSSRLPLNKADQCPDHVLNRILWRAMAGVNKPYPVWAAGSDED